MACRCFSGSISDLTRPLSLPGHLRYTREFWAANSAAPASDRSADLIYGPASRSSEGASPAQGCSFAKSRSLSLMPSVQPPYLCASYSSS